MDKKTRLRPLFNIECIQWDDAESIDQWEAFHDIKPELFPTIYSVGFVLKESKDAVVISLNFDQQNEKASCIMLIPKRMIKRRWVIKNGSTYKGSSNSPRRGR